MAATILIVTLIFILVALALGAGLGQYAQSRTKDKRYDNDNRKLTYILVLITLICMYIMWFSAYMHQLNPLIEPKLTTEVIEMYEGGEGTL